MGKISQEKLRNKNQNATPDVQEEETSTAKGAVNSVRDFQSIFLFINFNGS